MTQENKQLLLKDICARLPYKVIGRYCLYDSKGNLTDWGNEPEIVENIDLQKEKIWTDDTVQGYYLDEFKMYLRPMDSMTEEEKEEYEMLQTYPGFKTNHTDLTDMYDWLNAHHFDYRGLIPMRLALEASDSILARLLYIINVLKLGLL